MDYLVIFLSRYSSPGEAFAVGAISALLFSLIFAISRGVDKAKQNHKKDWEEIKKDDDKNN